MTNENVSLEFRLKKINETKNYLLGEIRHNDLMREKHKKTCRYFNYLEHSLLFISTVTGCVLVTTFASLVNIPIGHARSPGGIKICAITARIKNYKSIITKKRKKHGKIVLLAKTNLNTIAVLISKVLIDLYINHDKFISICNVLKEYNEIKEEIKNPQNAVAYTM